MEKQTTSVGRRKEAVTRIFISKGTGAITVNDKDYKTAKLDSANIALNQYQDRYRDLRQFQYQYKTEGNKIIEEKIYYKPKPEQKVFK